MYLQLHRLIIHLHSPDTAVSAAWQHLFAGWLVEQSVHVDARLSLQAVDQLYPLPTTPPVFRESQADDAAVLTVYAGVDGRAGLHYHDGAFVSVPLLATAGELPLAEGQITKRALADGRLEDITFTSLAPLLRQHAYFLLHAFAASQDGQAVLLVGPSGSGKTTSGLALLLHGWRLLANDVLLLERRVDGIYALPTPGGVHIRPQTFDLLPVLRQWLPDAAGNITGQQISGGQWAEPARAGIILFPRIEAARPSGALQPLHRAVALARLLAESVDRWDAAALAGHVDVLQILSGQTAVYDLQLGQDMANLPYLIENVKRKNNNEN